MTKPRDDRFSAPAPMGETPKDFLPDLKPGEPDFIEKLAKERGFKFTDKTRANPFFGAS